MGVIADFKFSFSYPFTVSSDYFCFSASSFRAASLLISSMNLSSSHRFAALARKLVLAHVLQLSSFNSMGMTVSVPHVRRKGDSLVV